ncbi:MAG: cyclic nucleotide-binding domain-containing protein [Verrucomicrobiae bacterium]|nr:cyclic nucleotide-binding domain-containing protein [Verrucomicrobiae bacterium]
MDNIYNFLPVFQGLDEDALEFLAHNATSREFKAGEVIIREGESGNLIYIISSGSVRVVKHFGQPNATELDILRDRDFFGEICLLDSAPRSATVQALTDTNLYLLTPAIFEELNERMPRQFCLCIINIARDLSRRLRRIDEVFAARH